MSKHAPLVAEVIGSNWLYKSDSVSANSVIELAVQTVKASFKDEPP